MEHGVSYNNVTFMLGTLGINPLEALGYFLSEVVLPVLRAELVTAS